MQKEWRKALIRQIKHSAVLFSCFIVFLLAWLLLKWHNSNYAYTLLIVGAFMIIPLLLYEIGWLLRGLLAIADIIKKATRTAEIRVFAVYIEGYQGTKNSLFADVYRVGRDSKFIDRILPIKSCFIFRHDICMLGTPKYYNNHTYRLTYLEYSRFIVDIEDMYPGSDDKGNSIVQVSVSSFAESIMQKTKMSMDGSPDNISEEMSGGRFS